MKVVDIRDRELRDHATHMNEFLAEVPDIGDKTKLVQEHKLDYEKPYLLGLPNKIGPLGYIALNNVLAKGFNNKNLVNLLLNQPVSKLKMYHMRLKEFLAFSMSYSVNI